MTQPNYLIVGHFTADVTPQGRIAGGTVSYTAPIARAFGHEVGIVAATAVGESLLSVLLPYAQLSVRQGTHTTTFENIYDHGKRTQYLHHTSLPLSAADVPSGWMNAPLVHIAPLVDDLDYDIVHQFPGATIMLTPQGWMRRRDDNNRVHFKRFFDEKVLRKVDIVIMSKQDIAEAPELEQEYAPLVKHLFVTDGERGGTYYHQGTPEKYDAVPVTEVEPTGAGDVFAGALLASLPLLNHDMRAATKVAARLAAYSVTRQGIENAVTPQEIQEALALARQE